MRHRLDLLGGVSHGNGCADEGEHFDVVATVPDADGVLDFAACRFQNVTDSAALIHAGEVHFAKVGVYNRVSHAVVGHVKATLQI